MQVICTWPGCNQLNRTTAKFCSVCGNRLGQAQISNKQAAHLTGRLSPQSLLNERYLVLQKVGQGGMGAVYQAEDAVSGQILAVKELSTGSLATAQEKQEAITRFNREATMLQRLRHQNLPFVTDRFTLADRHYLVMEYINGATLQEMVEAQEGGFAENVVADWAQQLCNVLSYLHSQSPPIIFRDLKPDNVMLTEKGQIKLIDFGIARAFTPGKSADTVALGTNLFAAPEQFGTDQTEARSDIYSLGVTMCCLLTGQEPPSYPAYHSPLEQGVTVTHKTDELIKKATAIDIRNRWQSIRQLQQSLPSDLPIQTVRVDSTNVSTNDQPVSTYETSRLTTQMLLKTAHFSFRQLTGAGAIGLLSIIAATWVLTPYLYRTWFWYNVPSIALVFGFAYAASRKSWVAALAQLIVTVAGGAITLVQTEGLATMPNMLAGAGVTALIAWGCAQTLPKILKELERDDPGAWQREMLWIGAGTLAIHLALATALGSQVYLRNVLSWLIAFLLGCIGWFIGDLIQGAIFLRQTGIAWRKRP